MRLPIEPLPPLDPGIGQDVYDILEPAAVAPAKRVQERSLPPLVAQPPRHGQGGGEAVPGEAAPAVERRKGGDRRQGERREGEQAHLLDTRTGRDRRKGPRRKDDPVTAVDWEV